MVFEDSVVTCFQQLISLFNIQTLFNEGGPFLQTAWAGGSHATSPPWAWASGAAAVSPSRAVLCQAARPYGDEPSH